MGKASKNWVIDEIKAVDLGDKRLNQRCLELLETLGGNPNESIPKACSGWAETVAAYRFFDNELVTQEKILKPHKEATIERIKGEKVVLLCQDTTDINYNGRNKIEGMGVLSEEYQQGFYLHPMLAITSERLCLGVVDSQIWTRKKLRRRRKKDIKERESYRWIKGYKVANEIAKNTPETMIVTVGDRESDMYELFCEGMKEGSQAHWLVRANHNREIVKGCDKTKKKLKEELMELPVLSEI